VKYVVHTSHNFERAAGAEVFQTAEVVAHEQFVPEVTRAYSTLPPGYATLDRNGNRRFESAEYAGTVEERTIALRDLNHDGTVTLQELYGYIAVGAVGRTYRGSYTITFGGREVELMHPGRSGAADMTVLYFPAERIVFAADLVQVRGLPLTIGRFHPREYIAGLRAVEALDFDTLITGRGERGTRSDIAAFRQYLETLESEVRSGRQEGRTEAELQANLRLNQYSAWEYFTSRRAANIAETYQRLRETNASVYVGPTAQYQAYGTFPAQSPCSRGYECAFPGGSVPGALVGVTISHARLGGSAEVAMGGKFWGYKRFVIPGNDDDFQHRDTLIAFLAHYALIDTSRLIVSAAAGPTILLSVTRTTHHSTLQQNAYDTTLSHRQFTTTVGADVQVPMTRGLSLVLPFRLSRMPRVYDVDNGLSTRQISVGVGLQANVAHRVH
jgi:glyoxylase-like metal-dependent hydrolase (beta-lactamase superfamily II)